MSKQFDRSESEAIAATDPTEARAQAGEGGWMVVMGGVYQKSRERESGLEGANQARRASRA